MWLSPTEFVSTLHLNSWPGKGLSLSASWLYKMLQPSFSWRWYFLVHWRLYWLLMFALTTPTACIWVTNHQVEARRPRINKRLSWRLLLTLPKVTSAGWKLIKQSSWRKTDTNHKTSNWYSPSMRAGCCLQDSCVCHLWRCLHVITSDSWENPPKR